MLSFFLRQVMLHQSGVLFDPLYFNILSAVVSKKTKYHGAFTVVEKGQSVFFLCNMLQMLVQ